MARGVIGSVDFEITDEQNLFVFCLVILVLETSAAPGGAHMLGDVVHQHLLPLSHFGEFLFGGGLPLEEEGREQSA